MRSFSGQIYGISSIKVEVIHDERFSSPASIQQAVFKYIEDYSAVSLHSTNGFLGPINFEIHFYPSLAS